MSQLGLIGNVDAVTTTWQEVVLTALNVIQTLFLYHLAMRERNGRPPRRDGVGDGHRVRRDAATWGLVPSAQLAAQLILDRFPSLYITSGRRTRRENLRLRLLARARRSDATLTGHIDGHAFDLRGPSADRQAAAEELRRWHGAKVVTQTHGTGPHLHAWIP